MLVIGGSEGSEKVQELAGLLVLRGVNSAAAIL